MSSNLSFRFAFIIKEDRVDLRFIDECLAGVLAGTMAVCLKCLGTGGCVGVHWFRLGVFFCECTEEYPYDKNTNIPPYEFFL